MGLRFFRRVRLLPGLTLNLSKSGISASVGVRGAHVTIGLGKPRVTAGIPGTGISVTSTGGPGTRSDQAAPRVTDEATSTEKLAGWLVFAAAIGLSILVILGISARFG